MPATNKLDFSNAQAAAKALKKVSTIMIRAGQPVVSSEFSDKARRVAGVTYREASLTVASGQVVVLRVNATGDIFQVVLNGSVQPMKNQTDSDKAVIEIAGLLEGGQVAFQKAQARKAIALPKGMSTPAPKQAVVYAERVAQLDTQIAERQAAVADLQQQLGAMTDGLEPLSTAEQDEAAKAAALLDAINEQPKGFPRKWGGKLYNFDQFKLVPADEHGELPGAWTLIDGAVPVADSLLDDIEPELTTLPDGISWLDFKLVDQVFVDKASASVLPSAQNIAGRVRLNIAMADSSPLDVMGVVVAIKFSAPKVYYSVALPIRLDSDTGQMVYAVLHDIDSIFVSGPAGALLDSVDQPQSIVSLDEYKEPRPDESMLTVAGAYVAAREIVLADPAMLDSVATAGAIEQLRQALNVVETNAPINEAEGNLDQAKLERSLAKSFTTAIAMLDSVNPDFGDSGLSELVNIALVSAADVSDIKDEDALAQLLALGMVETAEGLYMLTDKGRSALEDAGFDAYGEPFAAED